MWLFKLLLLAKRRWIQKLKFLKTEEFEAFACVFFQTPSSVRVLPLIQEGELFFLVIQMVAKNSSSWLRGGGFSLLKTEEFEIFCLCVRSNSLPLRVLPLIQEGELLPV